LFSKKQLKANIFDTIISKQLTMKASLKKISMIAILALLFSCEKDNLEINENNSLNFELSEDNTSDNEELTSIEDLQ